MKHRLEYCLAVIVGGLMRFFPRRFRLACGRSAGHLVYLLDRRHREVTLGNVDLAYGSEKSAEEKRAIAKGAFGHFGAMLFELLALSRPSAAEVERITCVEGAERYEKASSAGKGVILVTAHFGNWELHAIAHGYRFGPMHVVAREQDNRLLDRRLNALRKSSGNHVIYKQQAVRQTRRLIKDGGTVAFVIDQNVHLADAVFVDFFGQKAATTPVAAWFALKTGVALVPAFSIPLEDGTYRLVYEDAVDLAPYRELSQDDALVAITQELTRVQERYIRAHPHCWLWMHRRFRTRPPGATSAERRVPEPLEETPAAAAELR